MKLEKITDLEIPGVKIFKYNNFNDDRGYFSETYNCKQISTTISQINESFSKKNVFRGLHFQVSPNMVKMVRVISGHLLDLFLDIRKNSPTFKHIGYYELKPSDNGNEWIYLPAGIAHGNLALEDTKFEYLCDVTHNPDGDKSINVWSDDIIWPNGCKVPKDVIISHRDNTNMTLRDWLNTDMSDIFS